jgi:hypothetical protein
MQSLEQLPEHDRAGGGRVFLGGFTNKIAHVVSW